MALFLFTEKSFSGSPIDLTLEQTVNADAANEKKGIKSITNLIGARQHWAESSSLTLSRLWGTGGGGGGGACGLCPKSKARGVLAHRLPRFILLVSFSDTLLVVSILDSLWLPFVATFAVLKGYRAALLTQIFNNLWMNIEFIWC